MVCPYDRECVYQTLLHNCDRPPEASACPILFASLAEGKKNDADKPRWDLLPMSLIAQTVDVLTFGAKKYGPNNWQQVEDGKDRYYAALMRHIVAYRNGELIDAESGLSHLAHALCNLIFMHELADE